MKNCLILISLLISTQAFCYKISVYTDQVSKSKANEVVKLFKATYPFNQFDIEIEIVRATAEQLNCKTDASIERLVNCDSKFVRSDSLKRISDQAFIVRDMNKYGGSGGGIPVMTTHSPVNVMLHEYLHTLGFSDEYTYSASEAAVYCSKNMKTANMVIINPLDSYKSDSEARSIHSSAIPWFKSIKRTTLITHSKLLGTANVTGYAAINNSSEPAAIGMTTGLYKGHTCDKALPKLVSWHPGGKGTIMLNTGYGIGKAGETIVRDIFKRKGVKYKADCLKD